MVLLNLLDEEEVNVTVSWSNLDIEGTASVRDLWQHKNLGSFDGSFTATNLKAHSNRFLRIIPQAKDDPLALSR